MNEEKQIGDLITYNEGVALNLFLSVADYSIEEAKRAIADKLSGREEDILFLKRIQKKLDNAK